MKTQVNPFIFIIIAASLVFACNDGKKKDESTGGNAVATEATTATQVADTAKSKDGPVFTFEENEFDFGTINAGDKVNHTFTFKNTGNAPLVINTASAQCGCTVPEWPKDPVAPGESGKIKVSFDSHGKQGPQRKAITITANTQPEQTVIHIATNVKPGVEAMQGPLQKQ